MDENNILFSNMIVVRKDDEIGSDVYISCTELCNFFKTEADRMVEEGLKIVELADDDLVTEDDQIAFITAGATFGCFVDMGKLIADSALSAVGGAIVSSVSTIEDMGFTDE